ARWYQLFKEMPQDPWGNGYIYRCPGLKNPGGYDLYSAGPDRQADTADDDWGGGQHYSHPACDRSTSDFAGKKAPGPWLHGLLLDWLLHWVTRPTGLARGSRAALNRT